MKANHLHWTAATVKRLVKAPHSVLQGSSFRQLFHELENIQSAAQGLWDLKHVMRLWSNQPYDCVWEPWFIEKVCECVCVCVCVGGGGIWYIHYQAPVDSKL